ncbi:hypothetical protein [Pseudomonas extremaustralis]|uniref:hypothetical protein n=1 Tax=Pseudomonas extremaustralis TaxID=359110 RepID=UPI00230709D0|nr:hypothetical protein [Pseudomonas extremaustralis]MDB1113987.1 hypothetical protein [Pseudomonas extremaustralis]
MQEFYPQPVHSTALNPRNKNVELNRSKLKIAFRFMPLLIGFIASQKLSVGGEFYIGEILALIYLAINLGTLKLEKSISTLIVFGVIWAVCQFISDQVNQSDAVDSIKGVGAPLIFLCTFIALSIYFDQDNRRLPSFLLGAYLGTIPQFILLPTEYFLNNAWKWGIGQLVIGLFATIYTFFIARKKNAHLILLVFIFSTFSLFNDSRSMAIFPVIAVMAYILLSRKKFAAALKSFKGKFAATKMIFLIFAFLLLINAIFTAIFSSDWVLDKLPETSAKKFQMQASGEYGALLGGRSEMLVSIGAFLDKPLLGHGSWAKDTDGYQDKLTALKFALGYSEKDEANYNTDLIPVHSYLMGGLVWAGVGGGLFWIIMCRWLLIEFIKNFNLLGFYFYNGIIEIFWNILFSPFGASARWSTVLFISALYCYSRRISKSGK